MLTCCIMLNCVTWKTIVTNKKSAQYRKQYWVNIIWIIENIITQYCKSHESYLLGFCYLLQIVSLSYLHNFAFVGPMRSKYFQWRGPQMNWLLRIYIYIEISKFICGPLHFQISTSHGTNKNKIVCIIYVITFSQFTMKILNKSLVVNV